MAYGYKAIARAYALSGQRADCEKYLTLAQEAGERIQDPEDREIFLGDFTGGPWYGMR